MVSERTGSGVESQALQPVVHRILHVETIVPRGAFNQRGSIEHTQAPLAEAFGLPDHLPIEIGVQSVSTAVPRHDKDDVPNVGPGAHLDQIVESAEMRVDAVVEKFVRGITSSLGVTSRLPLDPLASHEAMVAVDVVSGIGDDNNCWARGSPPLQRVQGLLNTREDVW